MLPTACSPQNFKTTKELTEARWANTFADLQSIRFIQGPDAQVSGNTAAVTGVTIATLTEETQRNTASWTLVNEGGEWKLNSITIEQRDTL